MALVSDFPRIWNDPGTPVREKKRLVALMIEDVTLTRGTEITMHVRFKGELIRSLNVPIALNAWKKYMTAPAVLAEIDRLLDEHTDAEVARVLNERGLASGRRMKFTGQIIGALRKGNRLKSRYERLRERGMPDVTEMAALLGNIHANHLYLASARATTATSLQRVGSLSLRGTRSRLSATSPRQQIPKRKNRKPTYTLNQ
jgi:hypothetical protein